MASNDVRARDTRSPAASSCSARAASVRAFVSAMRTCVACGDVTGEECGVAPVEAGRVSTEDRRGTPQK